MGFGVIGRNWKTGAGGTEIARYKWHFSWEIITLLSLPLIEKEKMDFSLNVITIFYMYSGEKAMAPHSSTLAWKIPWVEEPGRLRSMGSLRVRHD